MNNHTDDVWGIGMKEKKQPADLLATEKPKAVLINRKLVITIAGIFVLIFLLITVNALRDASHHHHSEAAGITSQSSIHRNGANDIAGGLPSGYQDSQAIAKLLGRDQGGKLSKAVQEELATLKQQQAQLQAQLNKLRAEKTPERPAYVPPVHHRPSPMSQEVIDSAIFFPGGSPSSVGTKQNQNKSTQVNAQKNQTTSGDKNPKLSFLNKKPSEDIYNEHALQSKASPYELMAGSMIPAILINSISSDLPGNIIAEVTQNVYDSVSGQYLLIPKGSKLIGEYSTSISYGQSTLQAKFTRIILPNGESMILDNQVAANAKGMSGLNGSVDNHWGSIIGAALVSTLFNIPSVAANNAAAKADASNGTAVSSAGVSSAAGSLANIGSQITSKTLGIPPTIKIQSGTRFTVMVSKDLILKPYYHQDGLILG